MSLNKQDKHGTCNVALLLWERYSEFAFFCYATYFAISNINTESSVIETQQCIPFSTMVELQNIL